MNLKSEILAYQEGKLQASEILSRIRSNQGIGSNGFGLSDGQIGLLARQKLQPESAVYNVPWCFRILEKLDLQAFEHACRAVFEHHPLFRVHIAEQGGRPRHLVRPVPEVPVDLREVSNLDEAGVLAELSILARRPFALDRELPFRIHLLSHGPEEHFLLFVTHHIVIDGNSLPLLMASLWEAYDLAIGGEAPSVRPPDTGFEDFVGWQRCWLESDAAQADLQYWREILVPRWPVLTFGNTPVVGGAVAQRVDGITLLPVPAGLAEEIRKLAREARVAVSVVFLAAYRVLLSRFSGEADIVIGTAAMTRPQERFERSVGLFVNMVALRSTVSDEQRVSDLLHTEQRLLAEAMDHGLYPFSRLARELKIMRSDIGSSLYQAAFNYVGSGLMDWNAVSFEGVARHRIEACPDFTPAADCDFMLEIQHTASSFEVVAKYDGSSLGDGLVGEMLAEYSRVLTDMVADPSAQVASLGGAKAPATRGVPEPGRASAARVAAPSVHRVFERFASQDPDAVALHHRGERLTYGELNARANQLARYLGDRGIGAGSRVGLYGRNSPLFVLGVLAILKAGAAYLPLDPAYPQQRILAAVSDSDPAALLLYGADKDGMQALLPAIPVIDLDSAVSPWAGYDTGDLDQISHPGDLAYVMYTSGSTGQPKAVMVEHGNLVYAMEACRPCYAMTPADRMLQMASTSFDVSVLEIFSALTSGASLVIAEESWLESPRRFRKLCAENGVTLVIFAASLWHHLLVEDGAPAPASVRLVAIGGEQAPLDWIRKWYAQSASAPRLLNHYGPTEATIITTVADLTPHDDRVLIGRPLEGVQLHILDEQGERVAEGSTGELYIGGDGVARGYLNQPELTAARFVPDIFSDQPEARLYRTGDLVRQHPSGDLEFCGRVDRQVKLRGFRIELEEIEAQLILHPAINEAAVIVSGEDHGARRLVAFVKANEAGAPSPNEIRAFLGQILPDHMIPANYMELDAFPLGPNGKRDFETLARLYGQPAVATFVAPRTPLEEALATIFGQVLKRDQVGVHDNFFEIGGDSFSATQVIARIWDLLEVEISPPLLFELQNVADLAEEIMAMSEDGGALQHG